MYSCVPLHVVCCCIRFDNTKARIYGKPLTINRTSNCDMLVTNEHLAQRYALEGVSAKNLDRSWKTAGRITFHSPGSLLLEGGSGHKFIIFYPKFPGENLPSKISEVKIQFAHVTPEGGTFFHRPAPHVCCSAVTDECFTSRPSPQSYNERGPNLGTREEQRKL